MITDREVREGYRVCETCNREKPSTVFRWYRGEPGTECNPCRQRLKEYRRYEKLNGTPMTAKQMVNVCGNLIEEMFEHITTKKLADAKVGELVSAADRLFGIQQTLEGRPSRIITYKERTKTEDLLQGLYDAIKKHGETIDVTPTYVKDDHDDHAASVPSV